MPSPVVLGPLANPWLDVDHYHPGIPRLCCQFGHDSGEYAHTAPSLPAVVEGLRRALGRRGVLPHQPIALNVDYPAQYSPITNPRFATGLWEERLQALNLRFRQPAKVAHDPPQFGKMDHDATARSSSFMGPDCRIFRVSIFLKSPG